MVPIHDTDIGQERWSKAEWENYELWERVEHRLRRKKRLWILGTLAVFLMLSAIPIVMDRYPKWTTRSMTRQLAQLINQIKRQSITDRSAYKIRFVGTDSLKYVIEKASSCLSPQGQATQTGELNSMGSPGEFRWMNSAQGNELQIPGLISEFCYDYLVGNYLASKNQKISGFGIIPAKDLSERRLDRISVLILSGPSAEISFE